MLSGYSSIVCPEHLPLRTPLALAVARSLVSVVRSLLAYQRHYYFHRIDWIDYVPSTKYLWPMKIAQYSVVEVGQLIKYPGTLPIRNLDASVESSLLVWQPVVVGCAKIDRAHAWRGPTKSIGIVVSARLEPLDSVFLRRHYEQHPHRPVCVCQQFRSLSPIGSAEYAA